jgi:nitrogen fixation protein NifB
MLTDGCPAECKGAEAAGAEYYRKIMEHPCFSEQAQHKLGRMHLPVAPKCNIKCNYCDRRCDCVNESRPGVTSQVLTPAEAIIKVREVIAKLPFIKVIGIAGPGEPLYNDETFETLRLVKKEFPDLKLCLSSNGLLLPDKLDILDELGVGTITVTINAIDPKIGKEIYSWVRYQGKYLRGLAAAELLLSRQLTGVKGAVKRGIVIKVNTVLIPSINGEHLPVLAKKMGELGVYILNVIPLIPQSKFAHLDQPSPEERKKVQDACSVFIKQMRHCRQCRADAVGLLGQDMSREIYSKEV